MNTLEDVIGFVKSPFEFGKNNIFTFAGVRITKYWREFPTHGSGIGYEIYIEGKKESFCFYREIEETAVRCFHLSCEHQKKISLLAGCIAESGERLSYITESGDELSTPAALLATFTPVEE